MNTAYLLLSLLSLIAFCFIYRKTAAFTSRVETQHVQGGNGGAGGSVNGGDNSLVLGAGGGGGGGGSSSVFNIGIPDASEAKKYEWISLAGLIFTAAQTVIALIDFIN